MNQIAGRQLHKSQRPRPSTAASFVAAARGIAFLLILAVLFGVGSIALFWVAYRLKSALGIDLVEGPSFLHGLFF